MLRQLFCTAALVGALLSSSASFAQASCDPGTPAENMPAEFKQFAFIIGDFDINIRRMTPDGWGEPVAKARWNGRYSLDGRAIMDWWYGPGGAGVNIRMFDPKERLWKTAWHSTGNFEVRELRQRVFEEDGLLHLWQHYPPAPERNVYFKTFEDGRWARIDDRKDKDTGEWQPALMLEAIPAKCEPRN